MTAAPLSSLLVSLILGAPAALPLALAVLARRAPRMGAEATATEDGPETRARELQAA